MPISNVLETKSQTVFLATELLDGPVSQNFLNIFVGIHVGSIVKTSKLILKMIYLPAIPNDTIDR